MKKQYPNYKTTGLLLRDKAVAVQGKALKWRAPADLKCSKKQWSLQVLKDGQSLSGGEASHDLGKEASYLFGRDMEVCAIALAHPSCSSQHAVLAFRSVTSNDANAKVIRPYLTDLGSTNGTFVNGTRLIPKEYTALKDQDMIQFGNSSRAYVLLDMSDIPL